MFVLLSAVLWSQESRLPLIVLPRRLIEEGRTSRPIKTARERVPQDPMWAPPA
ncbi:MAG: hypothetical protein ACI8Y4_004072, partial [Candidatus Poriferisodalaceae bacterium]